ncbi:unnamed protein product (mitochondrion) [Plasmodiophora brassicae]|uniref:Uncharacterized protein n=1 Tax=Plasmodiophora brassicae TaxID=37360 RepID=A0A0G4IL76_PLABS|nr:hypothetical protein PBRA_004613 [Plasmodiophora brassicae]SPQ93529.1 unnamed protein product [Plasmodiophora brassicae]
MGDVIFGMVGRVWFGMVPLAVIVIGVLGGVCASDVPVSISCRDGVVVTASREPDDGLFIELQADEEIGFYALKNNRLKFQYTMPCEKDPVLTFNSTNAGPGCVWLNGERACVGQVNDEQFIWELLCQEKDYVFIRSRDPNDPSSITAILGFNSKDAFMQSKFWLDIPHNRKLRFLGHIPDCDGIFT